MNIVQPVLPDARVLDLFAGSGALGIEALSRGARNARFIDIDQRSLQAVRDNIDSLGAADRAEVTRADALVYAASLPTDDYDIVFADPPYATDAAARLAELWLARPFSTVIGIEHVRSAAMPGGGDFRRYGDSCITFYR